MHLGRAAPGYRQSYPSGEEALGLSLSRWENGQEKPTLESVVKVLAALGRDLGDLQDILAGTYLDRMMAGDSGGRVRREHGERVRAAYLGALRSAGVSRPAPRRIRLRAALFDERPSLCARRSRRTPGTRT